MIGFLFSRTGAALMAAVAALGLLTFTHVKAYQAGSASVREALKDDRITILKDGKQIDEKVLGADDSALCMLLGGCLPDNGSD